MLLYDGRSYAFQWDLNISLIIPKAREGQDIEFSFSKDENTATTKAYLKNDLIVADIPNFLLKKDGFLNVYHILEDEKGNRTIWRGQLRILKKEKPDDYPGSWEEEKEWDSLNKRVTELEKNQVQDTDTQYKLEANSNNARKFYLYSKEKDDTTWNTTPVSTITIPASTLAIGTSNGTVKFNGEDVAVKGLGSAAYEANTAFDKAGAAAAQVTAHNTSEAAHNDIRLLIQGLTGRLNALADSDDTTLDQLSEVVAYIKNNRSLIEAITTSKVSVADIVDNLTANVSNKPLSAAQGVVIKTLIDALHNEKLDVPTGEGQTGDVPVMQADGSTKWGKTGLDVSGAKVGQTVEITTVDAEGKPTAWKAVEYMTKANPTGTGAFSMGRKAGSTVGECSHAEGYRTTASGDYSHAEGNYTTALGIQSHAEGSDTKANRQASHAEGFSTIASSDSQHVQGKYNIEDADSKYAHIVGNGSSSSARSNAHTLDWSGNAWYAGTVEGTAVIVKSSTEGSTKRFKITVDDSGTISATEYLPES